MSKIDNAIDNLLDGFSSTGFKLTEKDSSSIVSVKMRLEQARLYEHIIQSDIFKDVSADQRALELVKEELKAFVIDRLETLMGLKQESKKATVEKMDVSVELPFSETELLVMKKVVKKILPDAELEEKMVVKGVAVPSGEVLEIKREPAPPALDASNVLQEVAEETVVAKKEMKQVSGDKQPSNSLELTNIAKESDGYIPMQPHTSMPISNATPNSITSQLVMDAIQNPFTD